MQQNSTGAVGLKARMLIDESIPIIDAAWRSFERWRWGKRMEFSRRKPQHLLAAQNTNKAIYSPGPSRLPPYPPPPAVLMRGEGMP